MISEHRLSALVGQIRGVDYQLTRKRELAGELAANTDEYEQMALLPAASALEAAESTDTATVICRFNDEEQVRLAEEIGVLEDQKSLLLDQLLEEGMQTGRWIGIGDRYVQLCGTDSTSSELRLHDIPRGYDGYILTDEDPQITARRVAYATGYRTAQRQVIGTIGLMVGVTLVSTHTPLPGWLVLIGVIAALTVSATVFREGSKFALATFSPFNRSPNSPWLEVMPDNGDRFDATGKSLPTEQPLTDEAARRSATTADEKRRGCAYAEIGAKRAEIEAKCRTKDKKGKNKA